MAAVTPNLQAVFNKWETRCPRNNNNNTERMLLNGSQKWRDKYGDRIINTQFCKSRQRAVPVENISKNVISQFKTTPVMTADSYITTRPVMGACCTCVPYSQKEFNVLSNDRNLGIHNVLDVTGGVRPKRFVDDRFKTLAYVLQRNTNHKYKDLKKLVLSAPRVLEAVQIQCEKASNQNRKDVLKQKPLEFFNVMRASITNKLIKLTAWLLIKFLSTIIDGVYVHRKQLAVIKKASEQGLPLIYLPLHLSHLDYILVTFILWSYDIKAPYVAAGNNLNIPVFNQLLRGLGGFFIRRKLDRVAGQKDLIYRAVLHTYMQEILKSGEDLEFFIEGGRTRTGRAYHPKGGLLSVVMETLNEGLIEDAYLVPISINYDKILDGNFCNEEMGVPKKKETFFGTIKSLFNLISGAYGSVRVDFCHPYSLKEYLQSNKVSSPRLDEDESLPVHVSCSNVSLYGTDVVIEDERQTVDSVAQHVLYCSVQAQALMSTNLVAFLLLNKHRKGTTVQQMINDIDWLKGELKARKRDVAFVGQTQEVLDCATDLLTKDLVVTENKEKIVPCTCMPKIFELSYYANPVLSVFLLESVVACSVIHHCDLDMTRTSVTTTGKITANREDILSTAEAICKLLQYDFIFCPPCKRLEEELADTLDELVTSEILGVQEEDNYGGCREQQRWARSLSATVSWDDEEEIVNDQILKVNIDKKECYNKLLFFYRVLAPILESYYLTALHISQNLKVELPEDSFVKDLHSHAKTRAENGIASFAESASLSTIKNAMKGFDELGIINVFYADNVRMVELKDHFTVWNKLNFYLDLLENLRN